MPARDEASLARAAAAGDGQAFATLYDEYEGRIFNFCLRVVGSREDAADATQDAFVKVLQRLPNLPADRELNFGAYLFTAARNASYDVIGKRKRADPVDLIPETGARPLSGDERGDIREDPERAAMLEAFQETVQTANAKLPERQREVLVLREVEELSYDEIAEIMDMNRNSVAQLISRARIKLRDELEGTALASIAVSSPECERALPLIAMRQDGQLKDESDREWLQSHIADCATCKVSIEAMSEAGHSYRMWAPVLPVAWLWKATAAHAMDLTGSDWSDLLDRPRRMSTGHDAAGAAAGAAAGGGLGRRRGLPRRLTRRAVVGTVFVALFGLLTLGAVVLSDNEPTSAAPQDAAETTSLPTDTTAVATAVHRRAAKSKKVVVTRVHHTASGGTYTTRETIVVPAATPVHARRPARTEPSRGTSTRPVTTSTTPPAGATTPPPTSTPAPVGTPVATTPPATTTPPPVIDPNPPPTTRPVDPPDRNPGGNCGPNTTVPCPG